MQLSQQELQLIEIIREQKGDDDVRIDLWFGDGLWRVSMSAVANGRSTGGNGVGETFDRAWDDLAPAAAKRPSLRVVPSGDAES